MNLNKYGITLSESNIYYQLPAATLVEHAVKCNNGKLTSTGSLVVYSGKHTGRAAKDKYIVLSPKTEKTIDWTNNVGQMTSENFQLIKKEVIAHFNQSAQIYFSSKNAGAIEHNSLAVDFITTSPNHCLFFDYLLRNDGYDCEKKGFGKFTIYHAPTLQLDAQKFKTKSSTAIITDLDTNEIIICGTLYAGEVKKSVFSVMNYILPEKKVFPMHSGSNKGVKGDVSVFFGLSGTGKTTLSTQEGRELIGDDEHGLSEHGIYNFEGGCYAKTYKLSAKTEPDIYAASTRFGALLENVVLNDKAEVVFDDKSIAENARSSYPLHFINNVAHDSKGGIPNHLFFLSADAFGVLPPLSKLTRAQAMYYFLSGYTAKLGGTEVGVVEPSATFSTCFGAPFMIRRATEYAALLGDFMNKHEINVWLINTGWTGGAYGVGQRFPLAVTRRLIEAVQNNELSKVAYAKEEVFGLNIPKSVEGVESKLLNPRSSWSDGDSYNLSAKKLAKMFHDNFTKFAEVSDEIKSGGPLVF